ncbi:hemolymph lipopolysaccharide-binding protein-like isoform X2 [Periplaneta americana]|uniref:hemolymph lipopolysaccharide-binding protein-like isoform X2 n=1 Tax=Periplaneta americana TaxID=6978 RepID=UPI0037E9A0D0
MLKCVLAFCVLMCFRESPGLQCVSPHTNTLKLSIVSRRNQTGHWVAQVQLGHEADPKDAGPWELDLDHTTFKCENSESVLITAIVTGPSLSASDDVRHKRVPSPGYDVMAGLGYYKLHTTGKTWNEALQICEQEGAHLLILNSEEEANVVGSLWDRGSKFVDVVNDVYAHIGFHNMYKNEEYVTIFNQSLTNTGFMKWASGHPTRNKKFCGLFGRNKVLADDACFHKRAFFCEAEM